MADTLTLAEIDRHLAQYQAWSYDGEALVRTFDRGDFNGAIAFVNRVAAAANSLDHHPDIALSWGAVTIRTWSHDAKGVTTRDFALIAALDAL